MPIIVFCHKSLHRKVSHRSSLRVLQYYLTLIGFALGNGNFWRIPSGVRYYGGGEEERGLLWDSNREMGSKLRYSARIQLI